MHAPAKHFTPAQKADIVRRHLIDKEPVSDLADRFGAQPSQVHNWVIDDNYISPPRQLQFPTRLFHCSRSFLDQFPSEIRS